jgi:hypothetical protein
MVFIVASSRRCCCHSLVRAPTHPLENQSPVKVRSASVRRSSNAVVMAWEKGRWSEVRVDVT